jgi:hypothetical protein
MIKTVLVTRHPGQQLAAEFKTKLLDTYSTAFGFASPQGGVHVDIDRYVANDHVLSEQLNLVEETYKDDKIFYWFCYADEGEINIESLQPFVLLTNGEEGDKERNMLVAMSSGDLSKHDATEESEFTNDYRMLNALLTPKVAELAEMADGNLDILMAYLDKPVFRNNLKEHLAPSGNLILISATGKAHAYAENPKEHGEFKWGFTTNTLGYTEDAPVVGKTDTPPVKGKLSLKTKAEGPPAPQPKQEEDKKVPRQTEADKKYANVLKDKRFYLNGEELWCRPQPGADWKEVRTTWNANCSVERPKGGKDDAVLAYKGWPVDQLKPNSPMKVFYNKAMNIEEKGEPKKADSEQAPVTKPAEPAAKSFDEAFTLLIPSDKREGFIKAWQKGDYKTADLSTLRTVQDKQPSATKQLGISLDEFKMLEPQALRRIVHDRGAQICIALLFELNMALLGQQKTEEQKPEKKEETPITQPKQKLSLKQKVA